MLSSMSGLGWEGAGFQFQLAWEVLVTGNRSQQLRACSLGLNTQNASGFRSPKHSNQQPLVPFTFRMTAEKHKDVLT